MGGVVELGFQVQEAFGGTPPACVIRDLRMLNKMQNDAKHEWNTEPEDRKVHQQEAKQKHAAPAPAVKEFECDKIDYKADIIVERLTCVEQKLDSLVDRLDVRFPPSFELSVNFDKDCEEL